MYSSEIQSRIDDAEAELEKSRARLEDLQADLHDVRIQIASLRSALKTAIDETGEEQTNVERIIAQNRSNMADIKGPGWEASGVQVIESHFDDAWRFAGSQLARLQCAMSATNDGQERDNSDHPSPLSPSDTGDPLDPGLSMFTSNTAMSLDPFPEARDMGKFTTKPASVVELDRQAVVPAMPGLSPVLKYSGGIVTALVPQAINGASVVLDSTYNYQVDGKNSAVPYRVYNIVKEELCQDQTAEELGMSVAAAMLAAEGRRAIVLLGGPSKPDIISLDARGNLWFTETKGSYKGTPLSQAGLLRMVHHELPDPLRGGNDPLERKAKMWENSPEWLRRSGADVLRVLTEIELKTEDPTIKAGVRELTLRYADAVAAGFEQTGLLTEIFQVGTSTNGESLPYLEPSATLQSYCAEVEPERITQVEVLSEPL